MFRSILNFNMLLECYYTIKKFTVHAVAHCIFIIWMKLAKHFVEIDYFRN